MARKTLSGRDKDQGTDGQGGEGLALRSCFSSDGHGPEGAGPKGPHDLEAWKAIDGVEMVAVSKLVDVMARADRVLSFGGG